VSQLPFQAGAISAKGSRNPIQMLHLALGSGCIIDTGKGSRCDSTFTGVLQCLSLMHASTNKGLILLGKILGTIPNTRGFEVYGMICYIRDLQSKDKITWPYNSCFMASTTKCLPKKVQSILFLFKFFSI